MTDAEGSYDFPLVAVHGVGVSVPTRHQPMQERWPLDDARGLFLQEQGHGDMVQAPTDFNARKPQTWQEFPGLPTPQPAPR